MRVLSEITVAALVAATVFSCVPVSEHQEVLAQLRVEQDRLREHDRRIQELVSLNESLGRRLRMAEIEREEALEKLALAAREVPLVIRQELQEAASTKILIATISFEHASVVPAEADLAGLAEAIGGLAPEGYERILIEGHSDPVRISQQSEYHSNMQISALRSLAVYHYIASLPGVQTSRLRLSASGQHDLRQRVVQVWMVPPRR